MSGLDHGTLNVPLAKRGNIDAQIDRYKAEQEAIRRRADREGFREVRRQRDEVRKLLDAINDERVLALAKPLGARKAGTAREKLYQAASSNLPVWLAALRREAPFQPGACAACRAPLYGCDHTPSEWLGAEAEIASQASLRDPESARATSPKSPAR